MSATTTKHKHPWEGPKDDQLPSMRCTPAERSEVEETASERNLSVARYMIGLHHEEMARRRRKKNER